MSENSGGQASCHTPGRPTRQNRSSLAGPRDFATAPDAAPYSRTAISRLTTCAFPLDGYWIPFRSLVGRGAFTMLSHARHTALDAIGRLLPRGRWDQEGVLVTNDFSMPAVPGAWLVRHDN
jgi:hypothetical protein